MTKKMGNFDINYIVTDISKLNYTCDSNSQGDNNFKLEVVGVSIFMLPSSKGVIECNSYQKV
ncbi:MAG: hypothetical protein HC932_02705 [Thermales bacterium]|nr:hypothetical protein [Thermales bacterium]